MIVDKIIEKLTRKKSLGPQYRICCLPDDAPTNFLTTNKNTRDDLQHRYAVDTGALYSMISRNPVPAKKAEGCW
ncbi:MAG: hypothetical protein H7Z13_03370 [Ferruginibacter sp.]|nr:hypothetical protein [Ferruginibacter sp.]